MSTATLKRPLTDSELVVNRNIQALAGICGLSGTALARIIRIAQPGVSARTRAEVPWTVREIGVLAEVFGVEPWELMRPDMTITPEMISHGVDMRARRDSNPQPSG